MSSRGLCSTHLVIVHPFQVATTYCRMDMGARGPAVRAGQWVDAGQVVDYVGMAGLTSGPHLRFITKKGKVFDPRTALPKYVTRDSPRASLATPCFAFDERVSSSVQLPFEFPLLREFGLILGRQDLVGKTFERIMCDGGVLLRA